MTILPCKKWMNQLSCVLSLRLELQQEKFISHPIRSLAQAYVCTTTASVRPLRSAALVRWVGYLMVICDYDEEAYFIWHLMIDAQHQDRGCGRAAMEAALAYIRSKPFGASNLVRLTVSPGKRGRLPFVPDPALLSHRPGGRG